MKPKITEKLFQEQVRKAALLTGWKYYHTFNSFRSPAGFPDCVLVHPKRKIQIVAELKSETGKVSEDQEAWLEAFRQVERIHSMLLRPGDFDEFWELLKA